MSESITYLAHPPGVREVSGYNHAVIRPGVPVFLTGQVAWDEAGEIVGRGDIAKQASQVWFNIERVLDELGATHDDIVKLTTYTTDLDFREAISKERALHFAPGRFPASTLLVVKGLADPDLLLEIEVIAMIPSERLALRPDQPVGAA